MLSFNVNGSHAPELRPGRAIAESTDLWQQRITFTFLCLIVASIFLAAGWLWRGWRDARRKPRRLEHSSITGTRYQSSVRGVAYDRKPHLGVTDGPAPGSVLIPDRDRTEVITRVVAPADATLTMPRYVDGGHR